MPNTGTNRNITIEALEHLKDPAEQIHMLAQYVKQLNAQFQRFRMEYPEIQDGIKDALTKVEYILKGTNGENGGLRGKLLDICKDCDQMKIRIQKVEERHIEFQHEMKILMAKAGTVLSIVMLIGVTLIGKIIDFIFP